jgi:hypothetical protein
MAAWSYFQRVFQLSVEILKIFPYNKENSEKTVLVHLLLQIIQL